MHQVSEKIKNEPFFKCPNKMVGNPEKRNRNLYCQYHRDHGHTTEDCRSLWDHFDQLLQKGKLKQLLHHSSGLGGRTNSGSEREIPLRPPLRTINVIFATPGRTGSCLSRVMSVAHLFLRTLIRSRRELEWNNHWLWGFRMKIRLEPFSPMMMP